MSPMSFNEAQCVKWVQAGDSASFGDLYDAYIEPIYRFVYFRIHHTETAEDLVSDIFVKALERIRLYNPSKGSFRTWLYQLARNSVIDYYRTRRVHAPLDEAVAIGGSAIGYVEDELLWRRIQPVMNVLTDDERDVVVLRLWQDLPHQEIAAVVGKNEVNCKKIYSRAMAKLRPLFADLTWMV